MEYYLVNVMALLTMVLWFWAIIDISRSGFKDHAMKTVWLIVVLFAPNIGSIFYFRYRNKYATKVKLIFEPQFNRE